MLGCSKPFIFVQFRFAAVVGFEATPSCVQEDTYSQLSPQGSLLAIARVPMLWTKPGPPACRECTQSLALCLWPAIHIGIGLTLL